MTWVNFFFFFFFLKKEATKYLKDEEKIGKFKKNKTWVFEIIAYFVFWTPYFLLSTFQTFLDVFCIQ